MVQAMERVAAKFILPEHEQYWGSIQICPYLKSFSAICLWQSDLDKAHHNGRFGTGTLVPNGALILCTFSLKKDTQDISNPKLACCWAWVHHSQKVYTVWDATDWAISLWQKGSNTVALSQPQVDSCKAPSPGTFPKVRVYFPTKKMPKFSMGEGLFSMFWVRWLLHPYMLEFQDQTLVIPRSSHCMIWCSRCLFPSFGHILYWTKGGLETMTVHWPWGHCANGGWCIFGLTRDPWPPHLRASKVHCINIIGNASSSLIRKCSQGQG